MAATQEALYAGRLDLDLSWSEGQLPERERTKHVHRLHPYLGKFVPAARRDTPRTVRRARRARPRPVCRLGDDARPGARVGPGRDGGGYRGLQLPPDAGQDPPPQPGRDPTRPDVGTRAGVGLRGRRAHCVRGDPVPPRLVRPARGRRAPALPRRWSSRSRRPTCCASSLRGRRGLPAGRRTSTSTFPARRNSSRTGATSTVARAVRSGRQRRFLLRYTLDTLDRIESFAAVRGADVNASVQHGDARELELAGRSTASSPRRRTRG